MIKIKIVKLPFSENTNRTYIVNIRTKNGCTTEVVDLGSYRGTNGQEWLAVVDKLKDELNELHELDGKLIEIIPCFLVMNELDRTYTVDELKNNIKESML